MVEGWTSWPAPAKLNLFLHIVGRRSDGYHLLQTVFQLLDLGDTLQLRRRADGVIERTSELAAVDADRDLCVRAARLLQAETTTRWGVDIALEKRIPIGGGLGGGSSDAASTLVGLNTLWELGLDGEALAALGLRLGADVPVFVRGYSAWAEGIGELITPIALPPSYYVILDPQVSVPTAELFQAAELTRNAPQTTIRLFLSGLASANAFEPVVRARFSAVDAALNWLSQFGEAHLSGSGACVFLAVSSMESATAIARQCPDEFTALVARGIDRSPLLAAVEKVAIGKVAIGTSPSW
jgi:4-diphosphocytidyl-2-C-methyl-D-erythritol kinase